MQLARSNLWFCSDYFHQNHNSFAGHYANKTLITHDWIFFHLMEHWLCQGAA